LAFRPQLDEGAATDAQAPAQSQKQRIDPALALKERNAGSCALKKSPSLYRHELQPV
jgi:hypothetical protein